MSDRVLAGLPMARETPTLIGIEMVECGNAMILYALTCDRGHAFDAWFRGSDAFESQLREGAVSCPICGSANVKKAPMAPRIGRGAQPPGAEAPTERPGARAEDEVAQLLAKLRQHIETHCEDVGERFVEEARRIHYGEAEERAIFGEASLLEAAALREEGIAVHPVPWFVRRNG